MSRNNARNKEQAALMRARVAELALFGNMSQLAIGKELGISQGAVSKHLAALREDWAARHRAATDAMVAQELAKLDKLEAEALRAWQDSRKAYEQRTVEQSTGTTRGNKARVVSSAQYGDPRLLQVLLQIQDRRAKLLSLDLDKRQDKGNLNDDFAAAVAAAHAKGDLPV